MYLERVDIINIQTHANKVMRSLTSWKLHKFSVKFQFIKVIENIAFAQNGAFSWTKLPLGVNEIFQLLWIQTYRCDIFLLGRFNVKKDHNIALNFNAENRLTVI